MRDIVLELNCIKNNNNILTIENVYFTLHEQSYQIKFKWKRYYIQTQIQKPFHITLEDQQAG